MDYFTVDWDGALVFETKDGNDEVEQVLYVIEPAGLESVNADED